MPLELELKLRINDNFRGDIASELEQNLVSSKFLSARLNNIYYDTHNLKLRKSNIALRIRESEGDFLQTLKSKGFSFNGLHERSEWEWKIENAKLNESLLLGCSDWPSEINMRELRPIFKTNFMRKKTRYQWKGTVIELAIDEGCVISKEREQRIHEIELELIDGKECNLLELGERMQRSLPVSPSNVSKAEQGYQLFMRTD